MKKAIINITDDTPIAMLTVGQLREVLFPKALLDLIEKQQIIEEELARQWCVPFPRQRD